MKAARKKIIFWVLGIVIILTIINFLILPKIIIKFGIQPNTMLGNKFLCNVGGGRYVKDISKDCGLHCPIYWHMNRQYYICIGGAYSNKLQVFQEMDDSPQAL